MAIVVTEDQIDDQISRALDAMEGSPNDEYARGVREALGWVIGEEDHPPMDD